MTLLPYKYPRKNLGAIFRVLILHSQLVTSPTGPASYDPSSAPLHCDHHFSDGLLNWVLI